MDDRFDLPIQRIVVPHRRRPADAGVRERVDQQARRMRLLGEERAVEHRRLQHRNLQAADQRLDAVGQILGLEDEVEQHRDQLDRHRLELVRLRAERRLLQVAQDVVHVLLEAGELERDAAEFEAALAVLQAGERVAQLGRRPGCAGRRTGRLPAAPAVRRRCRPSSRSALTSACIDSAWPASMRPRPARRPAPGCRPAASPAGIGAAVPLLTPCRQLTRRCSIAIRSTSPPAAAGPHPIAPAVGAASRLGRATPRWTAMARLDLRHDVHALEMAIEIRVDRVDVAERCLVQLLQDRELDALVAFDAVQRLGERLDDRRRRQRIGGGLEVGLARAGSRRRG